MHERIEQSRKETTTKKQRAKQRAQLVAQSNAQAQAQAQAMQGLGGPNGPQGLQGGLPRKQVQPLTLKVNLGTDTRLVQVHPITSFCNPCWYMVLKNT